MAEHALDRKVCFAGVSGSENCCYAARPSIAHAHGCNHIMGAKLDAAPDDGEQGEDEAKSGSATVE
jgi:hypothetical protein